MTQTGEGDGRADIADDELKLLARLRANEESAFEELVRTFSPRLMAVARRIVGNDEDTRDVIQEAFLSAFRSLDRFAGEAKLSTWLHRIVINTALMKLRRRRRKPEESIEPLLPAFLSDGHHAERFASWSEPADRSLSRKETREAARASVSAGARFLVSPIMDPEIITESRALDVPMIPGCYTPTEMETAHRHGATFIKVFPMPAGGPAFIEAIRAPLPHLKLFPTAGITLDNFVEFLRAGCVGAGFVRPLFEPEDLKARRFDAIRKRAERRLGP